MDKSKLSDDEWVTLMGRLKKTPGIRVGCEATCRQFVEAVLWILRSGAQWRLLPDRLGHWNSVFKRFARWSRFGVWEQLLDRLCHKADLQNVCIDSTVIRAHACAAGAAKSHAAAEALGRSRGGFSCKTHALTDALGLPVHFILTGGQAADITQAIPLMEGIRTGALLADKGYDADALLDWLKPRYIAAVIPPKANRKVQRSCDWYLYKERHVIECMFGKLKYYRRIASRFEKKASVCNLNPTSRGSVRIRSAHFENAPSIAPNYLGTAEDRQVAADSLRVTRRIASQPAMAKYQPEEFRPGPQYETDEQLARLAGDIGTTIFHPVGTAKMGSASDPLAVVDSHLRVHGIGGLRVVDASVMPTITSGNTNSPTLLIAEKAARWIAADL